MRARSPRRVWLAFALAAVFSLSRLVAAGESWASPATGQSLALELLEPETPPAGGAGVPVVFYLKNLAAPRVGTEPDEPILRDLRAAGHLVAVIDYANHPGSVLPGITPTSSGCARICAGSICLPGTRSTRRERSSCPPAAA